jgi:hypothetical protein
MDNRLLQLIDDIELLLRQDKRFYDSNDHLFKNNINKLCQVKPIDVTSIVNLAKLNTSPWNNQPVSTNNTIQEEPYDLAGLEKIVSNLKYIINIVDKF